MNDLIKAIIGGKIGGGEKLAGTDPFIYDSTSPEAFSKDYGTELFEALKSGRPCYYYSTECNPNYALILGYDEPNIFSSGGNTICSFTFHFFIEDASSPASGYFTNGMAWMYAPDEQ